jgi:prepilin-type N-terminal cleavage/methylation domain-containing protein/prepilin-type processing-associated H-X9-DG protein
MSRSWSVRRGFTLVELLVVISIIGVLMSLLLPAINAARESGRNTQCKSNLKNLGLACLESVAKTGHYPTGGWGTEWVGFADGGNGTKQPGGWVYNLLPYLEETPLHDLTQNVTADAIMQTDIAREVATTQSIMTCPTRRSVQAWSLTGAQVNLSPLDPINGGQINLASAGTQTNTVARGDYAANAGVRYTTGSGAVGTNGEVQYGCITVPGTDYPNTYKTSGSNPTVQTTGFTADTFTGVIYQRSNLGDGSVQDGTSKTYLIGEKFIDRRHYEDGLYVADAGNMYSGMGADNYRTTFVLPASTTVSTTTGVDPTDPGNAVATSTDPTKNYGVSMLNDQADPGGTSTNYGYYSCIFGSAHSGTVNFVFCDGAVRSISVAIDPLTHRYLGERNDSKILDDAVIGE